MTDEEMIKAIAEEIPKDICVDNYYPEEAYQLLLHERLRDAGFKTLREVQIRYETPDHKFYGIGYIDILVETHDTVYILELKANVKTVFYKGLAQTRRYMENFKSNKSVKGFLVTFNCDRKPFDFHVVYPKKSAKDVKKVKIYKRDRDVMKMESDELLKNYIVKMPKPSHILKPPAVALHQSHSISAKVSKSPLNSV